MPASRTSSVRLRGVAVLGDTERVAGAGDVVGIPVPVDVGAVDGLRRVAALGDTELAGDVGSQSRLGNR